MNGPRLGASGFPSGAEKTTSFRRQQIAVMLVSATMLLGTGSAVVWFGAKIIKDRHWSTTKEVTRTVALPGWSSTNRLVEPQAWDGSAAQVLGAGFVGMGVMMGVWAAGCLRTAIQPKLGERPGALSGVSAVLFALTTVCVMPPWTIGTSPTVAIFWGVLLLWFVAIAAFVARFRNLPRSLVAGIGGGLFVATILFEMFVPLSFSGGAGLAVIVVLFSIFHAMYLYGPWRRRAIRQERTQQLMNQRSSPSP